MDIKEYCLSITKMKLSGIRSISIDSVIDMIVDLYRKEVFPKIEKV